MYNCTLLCGLYDNVMTLQCMKYSTAEIHFLFYSKLKLERKMMYSLPRTGEFYKIPDTETLEDAICVVRASVS